MPRSQRPRRKRAHPATRRDTIDKGVTALSEVLSVNRSIADCAPGEQAARIQGLRDAVEALGKGKCTPEQMGDLIDAANIAGYRVDTGDFPESVLPVRAAKAACESLYETLVDKRRYIAHSFELNNLRHFINHYEAMMQNSTTKEWNTAQRKLVTTYSRMRREGVAA